MVISVFLMASAVIAASALLLEYDPSQGNRIFVSSLEDDDGSIRKVNIFLVGAEVEHHRFYDVKEGFDFSLQVPENGFARYNFSDSDGSEIGLGVNREIREGEEKSDVTVRAYLNEEPLPAGNVPFGTGLDFFTGLLKPLFSFFGLN